MMDKQLKLIYEYMSEAGWFWNGHQHCRHIGDFESIAIKLDSNSAWEVVQEMERKGDWGTFDEVAYHQYLYNNDKGEIFYNVFLMNPENFFNCFAKWLLEKKEEKMMQIYEASLLGPNHKVDKEDVVKVVLISDHEQVMKLQKIRESQIWSIIDEKNEQLATLKAEVEKAIEEAKRLNALRLESGKMVAEAIKQSENLQCCGNCRKREMGVRNISDCPEFRNLPSSVKVTKYCTRYQSDQLTRSEREI